MLRAMLDKWMPDGAAATAAGPELVVDPSADTLQQDDGGAGLAVDEVLESASVTLDTTALADLVGDDPEAIQELLQDFRHYGHSTAVELLQAHADGQAEAVCTLAHKLKSSSRSVGAIRLSDYCARLESAARQQDLAKVERLIPLFEAQMAEVDQLIAAF